MAKHLVKVERSGKGFRVNIPRRLVGENRWEDVQYVFIKPGPGHTVVIEGFLGGKDLKTEDR
ncbi:hypothetical protein ES708_25432 [subsurface metagenome]